MTLTRETMERELIKLGYRLCRIDGKWKIVGLTLSRDLLTLSQVAQVVRELLK